VMSKIRKSKLSNLLIEAKDVVSKKKSSVVQKAVPKLAKESSVKKKSAFVHKTVPKLAKPQKYSKSEWKNVINNLQPKLDYRFSNEIKRSKLLVITALYKIGK